MAAEVARTEEEVVKIEVEMVDVVEMLDFYYL